MPAPVLAIDFGGTKVLAALVAGADILDLHKAETPRGAGAGGWLDAIVDLGTRWRGQFGSVAVAVTGLVADERWWALNPAVLPVPAGFPLVRRLAERFALPVFAVNDAQAAAWGEYRFGAGQALDIVFATISTGIGGGLVLGGRLLTGRGGLAGHIGQLLVGFPSPSSGDAAGERSGGTSGSSLRQMVQAARPVPRAADPVQRLEDIVSGSAIAREAARLGHPSDALEVFAAAERQDAWAEDLVATAARRLALGLGSVQMLVDPDCIVVGGGVGLAPGFIERVRVHCSALPVPARPHLRPAALGGNAGLLGAADLSLFRTKVEENS